MSHGRFPGFRVALNGGAAAVTVSMALLASGALAQVAQPQTPQIDAASKGANTDEIIVTGTLIRNPNLALANPVNVVNSSEIDLRQANTAEEILRDVPGIIPNIGGLVNNGSGGIAQVDLRGLGANRNVVLLDSGRIVPSSLAQVVDTNNIPIALIDRVDVLTGGASVTYGADAIAGVVNFVIKKNFTGIQLDSNQQIAERGNAHQERTQLTVGGNFADDRGNAVVSVGYQKVDPLYQSDRAISTAAIDSFTGAVSGSGTTIPSRFSVPGRGTLQINPSTGLLQTGSIPFNYNPYNVFQTPYKNFNIFTQANYKASDAVEVYARGLFDKNQVSTIIAPSGVFSSLVTIPLSNPYLPAGARNQLCAANGITPAQCDLAATASTTNSTNYRTVNSVLRRRTTETGSRESDYTTTVFDIRAGVRGRISDHLHYDVYGDYGESENRQNINGYVGVSRVRNALLATNTTTCLDGSANCVPLNVFGPGGSITPAQAAYITEQSTTSIRESLAQVGGLLNGDVGFGSPFASTPINFAIGGEYREYRAQQLADALAQTAGELGGAGAATIPFQGGYNVVEGFGELTAPIIQDKPFFKSLTLDAGIRYSSYSLSTGAARSYNTTTYEGGATWELFKGFKIRGTYERAVRAPNIAELFFPKTVGLTNNATDPCAGAAPTTNANLRAVCLAQGAPGNTIGLIELPSAGQPNSTTQGNRNISPEKADTFTIGTIIQPDALRGFSLSFDYYHIVVNSAITNATPSDVINSCFANVTAASAGDPACLAIARNPTTGALDGDPATTGGLSQPLTNRGRILTNGLDAAVNYQREFGPIKVALGFQGNYVFQAKFSSSSSSLNRECSGFYSVSCDAITGSLQPKYQWSQRTTLSFEAVDISLLWRHIAPFSQEPDDAANGNGPAFTGTVPGYPGTQNFAHINAFDYFDLSARFNITKNLRFTVAALNLTDKAPPLVGYNVGSTTFDSGNTFPSTYDPIGRRYSATISLRY